MQNNAVSVPKLQICNHSIYNIKIESTVRFERFESINLKHSISELELDCFFFRDQLRAQKILLFEFKFEFAALIQNIAV